MTQDFAKKPKPVIKKVKPAPKSQVPGWVWLLTGIVTGIFISFLGYLADITPTSTPEKVIAKVDDVKDEAKKITTKFDFYTLLPEHEVIVAGEEEEEGKVATEATTGTEPAAGDIKQQPAEVYILQAGSFKTAPEADRLRAKLLLMGLETSVEAVSNANGVWHRVQVGPFTDRSKLATARSTLIDQKIDTLLLKRKVEG